MSSTEEDGIRVADSDGEDSCISLVGLINGSDCSCRGPSPPPPDPFEFFSTGAASAPEMCAADDIFVSGRMLPSNPTRPTPAPPTTLLRSHSHAANSGARRGHRRSESMGVLDSRRPWDYHRLRRASSDSEPAGRAPRPKPRWYWFVFGSVRMPEPAMEMSEIRSRLQRRGAAPAEVGRSRWEPWKLIQSLSCKGVESAAATAPPPLVSHSR